MGDGEFSWLLIYTPPSLTFSQDLRWHQTWRVFNTVVNYSAGGQVWEIQNFYKAEVPSEALAQFSSVQFKIKSSQKCLNNHIRSNHIGDHNSISIFNTLATEHILKIAIYGLSGETQTSHVGGIFWAYKVTVK